ncbi:MAG: rRNA maturation RNase YbeY [Synergistes sp.]|nr:rRNA maturation RNase YbeY [Synergistes sp.]
MKTVINYSTIDGNTEDITLSADDFHKLEKIFSEYIESEHALPDVVEECGISLTFTNACGIEAINDEYRDIAEPTDVLSFPMWENEDGKFAPPADWDDLPLGDIVVCPEIIAANAAENSRSERQETILVICHGFLHLLGFDHADDDARDVMWAKQDALVEKFMARDEQ